MSDAVSPSGAADSEANLSPPPLRAAFLVWPGQAHGQFWFLVYLGFMFALGAILPWHGADDRIAVLSEPYTMGSQIYTEMPVALHRFATEQSEMDSAKFPALPPVTELLDPGMGIGRALLLISAIAMIIAGFMSVWQRRLKFSPTLCILFLALAMLYFHNIEFQPDDGKKYEALHSSGGFGHFFGTVGEVFGNFGSAIEGRATPALRAIYRRAGTGFYLTMLAELALILFIVFSIVTGGKSKKDTAPAGGSSARRPRPGGFGKDAKSS